MGLYNWVDFNYFYLSTSILEKIYFYRKLNLLTEKFSLENVSSFIILSGGPCGYAFRIKDISA